jgi:glycosyltransferase involved in cell wall biosynthesis
VNVLHVIPAVAERYGGPSHAVFDMCRALAAIGVSAQIASTDADGPGRLPVALGESIVYHGVPVMFFRRQWSESFKYSRPLRDWLFDSVRRFDVVHIHAVYSHAPLAAASAARARRVPYIVRPLGTLSAWALRQKPLRKRVGWHLGVGRMLEAAAAIHCTSAAEASDLRPADLARKAVVIPLGVAAAPADGMPPSANPYVLALGRIHPKKGLDALIRGFADAVEESPSSVGWRLVVAGTGDDAYVEQLRALAKATGCADRVQFTGWISGDARESALRGAAIVAMPSHQENFGFAAFEAMARGVPVLVGSATDFAQDIAAAGAGWIADADARALGGALREIMRDDGGRRRRGAAGRALVERRFTWDRVAHDMEGAYARVILAAS